MQQHYHHPHHHPAEFDGASSSTTAGGNGGGSGTPSTTHSRSHTGGGRSSNTNTTGFVPRQPPRLSGTRNSNVNTSNPNMAEPTAATTNATSNTWRASGNGGGIPQSVTAGLLPVLGSDSGLGLPGGGTERRRRRNQQQSSATWTSSSGGDLGERLSDTDDVQDRGDFVREYNRLAKKVCLSPQRVGVGDGYADEEGESSMGFGCWLLMRRGLLL